MFLKKYSLLFKHLSLTTINSVLFSLSQIVIQIIVVRNTDLGEYGIFAFTFSIFSIFELLILGYSSDRSIQILGVNSIHKKLETQGLYLGYLFRQDFILFFIGIPCAILIGFCFLLNTKFSIIYYLVLLFGMIFNIGYSAIKNSLISYNLVEVQTRYELKCIALNFIMSTIFSLIWGVIGFLVAMVLYNFIKLLLGLRVFEKLGLKWKEILYFASMPGTNKDFKYNIAIYSFFRNGLVNVYSQLDILLLGILPFSSHLVAQYKIAKTLSGLPTKIVYPVWAALRGRILEAHYSLNLNRLIYLIGRPTIVFVFVFILIYLFSSMYAVDVLTLLYGIEYQDSAGLFLILLAGTLILQLTNNWFNFWVVIANKSGSYILCILFQMLILFSVVFYRKLDIPFFSAIVACSMIFGALFQALVFWSSRKIYNN